MSIPVRETKRKIPGSMLVPLCKGSIRGVKQTDLYNMSSEIIKHYGSPNMKVENINKNGLSFLNDLLEDETDICVAIILSFNLGTSGGHFVPYVKIGNDWYNGDDQKGYLRRKAYAPTSITPYHNSNLYSKVTGALVFTITSTDIRDNQYSNGRSLTGIPTPGQTGVSCGSDSLQVVFMWANGYRNHFLDIFRRISDYPEVIKGGELLNLETSSSEDILRYIGETKDTIFTRASLTITNTEVDSFFFILLLKYKSFELEPRKRTEDIADNMLGGPGNGERGTAAAYNMHMMEEEQRQMEEQQRQMEEEQRRQALSNSMYARIAALKAPTTGELGSPPAYPAYPAYNMHMMKEEKKGQPLYNNMYARLAALKAGGGRYSYKKTRKSKKTRKHR